MSTSSDSGSYGDNEDAGLLVARVTVERRLYGDGRDVVWSEAHDGDDGDLTLVETLGLLELAKDTAIRTAMGEGRDADEN